MKQQSKLLLSLLHGAGVGAALMSGGAMVSSDAQAGISNTRHNLGTTNASFNRVTGGGTNEICVFCHTPHGADTGTAEAPPLWNKRLDTSRTYTTYAELAGRSTLDAGGTNGSTSTGSVSLACLSCHDGAQAMDNMINAPGSGGYNSNGGTTNGQSSGTLWNWNDPGTNSAGVVTGEGLLTDGITSIGQDLRNDHPIGIAYCGGITGGTYSDNSTANCRDADFKPPRDGGSNLWYIDTSGAGGSTATTRDKTDMILYWRNMGGASRPSVECASCHDPHVESVATNQTAFLRVSQLNSGLCLACHVK